MVTFSEFGEACFDVVDRYGIDQRLYYEAHLKGNQAIWGVGKSPNAAILNALESHPQVCMLAYVSMLSMVAGAKSDFEAFFGVLMQKVDALRGQDRG